MPELVVCENPDAMAAAAAERIAAVISAATSARGACSVVLAGGGTPRPVYARLAESEALAWEGVQFFFGDERCVPLDDPDSNHAMAWSTLLGPAGIEADQVHPMPTEGGRPELAEQYARALPDPVDLVLLGMGGDGHTASLFPGRVEVTERARRVIPVEGAPKPPPQRYSITAAVIESARDVFVLVQGAGKAATVARALEGPVKVRETPIQLALEGVWFLDAQAASGMRERGS